MISQANLQEELIPRCLDVLSKISNGERDLIRVVVDVVTELREGEEDEDMDGVSVQSPISIFNSTDPYLACTEPSLNAGHSRTSEDSDTSLRHHRPRSPSESGIGRPKMPTDLRQST